MTNAAPNKIPQRLFYPRAETANLLVGISNPTLKRFEDSGRLTPVRLSGRRRGSVFFEAGEVLRLRDDLVMKAKAAAAKSKIKRLKLAS
jgi:hypothetical protein